MLRKTELTLTDRLYDLVIASTNGYPKDINLYQAQKALTHASLFCRDGGTVLLAAVCNEGVGSQGYIDFMQGVKSHAEAREKLLKAGFQVGPHKAFQFALIAERINFLIKTEIDPAIMQNLPLTTIDDMQTSVNQAIQSFAAPPRVAIVPFATATIPQLRGG